MVVGLVLLCVSSTASGSNDRREGRSELLVRTLELRLSISSLLYFLSWFIYLYYFILAVPLSEYTRQLCYMSYTEWISSLSWENLRFE